TTNPALPGVPGGTPVIGFAPVAITTNATFAQGNLLNEGEHCGGRLTIGFWCDPDQNFGVEASGFILDQSGSAFASISGSSGNNFNIDTGFARNLFLVQGGSQTLLNTIPIIVPRTTTSALIGSHNDSLVGGEINGRCIVAKFGCAAEGELHGFRTVIFPQ